MTGTSSNAALNKSELFAQLVAEHQRALYLHILTMVPHTADAEEILQETNLVIWQHAADFEIETNFRAWSFAIAYHRVLKYREKSKRDGLMFNSELVDVLASETSANNDSLESQLAALSHCTQQLRPADRELLFEYYRNGSGGLAAAKRFQRPVGSIYKSVCRIRKALMRCMMLHRLREEHA
jgi:RNA polymerase sigma-70 factor (ECF subfamily)